MPTGPPFHPYQISSYGAHKDVSTDSCFREDNYIMKKVRVVSLACDMPTGFPLHPYQILSNYLSLGVMACTRFLLQER